MITPDTEDALRKLLLFKFYPLLQRATLTAIANRGKDGVLNLLKYRVSQKMQQCEEHFFSFKSVLPV